MVHFGLVTRGYNIVHDSHLEETEYTDNISIRIPVFSEQGIKQQNKQIYAQLVTSDIFRGGSNVFSSLQLRYSHVIKP